MLIKPGLSTVPITNTYSTSKVVVRLSPTKFGAMDFLINKIIGEWEDEKGNHYEAPWWSNGELSRLR